MKVKNYYEQLYLNKLNLVYLEMIYECYYNMPQDMIDCAVKIMNISDIIKRQKACKKTFRENPTFKNFKKYVEGLIKLTKQQDVQRLMPYIIEDKNMNNFIFDFIPLVSWINKNHMYNIKQLNENECAILMCIYANFDKQTILEFLSPKIKEIGEQFINETVINIEQKLGVTNMVQAAFKATLLKPFLWKLNTFSEIMENLKNMHLYQ